MCIYMHPSLLNVKARVFLGNHSIFAIEISLIEQTISLCRQLLHVTHSLSLILAKTSCLPGEVTIFSGVSSGSGFMDILKSSSSSSFSSSSNDGLLRTRIALPVYLERQSNSGHRQLHSRHHLYSRFIHLEIK